jgi:hypothetical protein
VKLFVVVLPRVHGVARKAGEEFVGVKFRVAILRGVEHERAEAVGAVIGEVEEERAVLVLLDELDAAPRPQVGRVTFLAPHLAILDDVLIVKLARRAIRFRDPKGEAVRRLETIAEVPLAAQAANVARAA